MLEGRVYVIHTFTRSRIESKNRRASGLRMWATSCGLGDPTALKMRESWSLKFCQLRGGGGRHAEMIESEERGVCECPFLISNDRETGERRVVLRY